MRKFLQHKNQVKYYKLFKEHHITWTLYSEGASESFCCVWIKLMSRLIHMKKSQDLCLKLTMTNQKKFLTQTNLSLQITGIFICLPEIFRGKEDLTFEITVEETFLTFLNLFNLFTSTPAGIYLFKFNNGNIRTIFEICSKLNPRWDS